MRETLKAARVNRKLRQRKVAQEIGVSRATLSAWENGRSFPRMDKVQKLAKVYQKEAIEFVFNMEDVNET